MNTSIYAIGVWLTVLFIIGYNIYAFRNYKNSEYFRILGICSKDLQPSLCSVLMCVFREPERNITRLYYDLFRYKMIRISYALFGVICSVIFVTMFKFFLIDLQAFF